VHLVERPNDDFAVTMARQLLFSTYQLALYGGLQASADPTLAGVAAKAVKEVDYHRDHATQWVLRLGDGTDESHRRMQDGLERMWPYADELFVSDDLEQALVRDGVAVDASALRPGWDTYVDQVLAEATLTRPDGLRTPPGGGRRGIHTEAMGYLLAEMQHLHRAHPGAKW
jgi:ring-1,2-phenylacetyl-CoA epoxidase subunit PaaC